MNEQLVFDTSLYKNLPPEIMAASMREDLTSLVIENGNIEFEKRINPRELDIIGNEVIDSITKKNILDALRYDTPLDKKESKSAIAFFNHLLSSENSLSLSISPPGGESGYLEGRVNVGFRNSNKIEFYGIPTRLLPDHLMQRALFISSLSTEILSISSPEELREISISLNINDGENSWDLLEEIFPLDSNVWKTIKSGEPWVIKKKAERDAKPIAEIGAAKIVKTNYPHQYIYIGAQMEAQMQQMGWEINGRGCPGKFNSQLIGFGLVVDSYGNERIATWEYHIGTCGNCLASNVKVGPCSICQACEKIL